MNRKKRTIEVVSVFLVLGLAGWYVWHRAGQKAAELKSEKARVSYALGMNVAKQLLSQSVEVDTDFFMRGLQDTLSGHKPLLSETEVLAKVNGLRSELMTKQIALQREMLSKNKKEGEAFLAENKTKEGVVALEDGLQYKVLKAGNGKKPTANDTVVAHYRGSFINGKVFSSSYESKQPAIFSLKKTTKGWQEALQLMPVGSKWQLFIPSNLAYGEHGVGGSVIGPNATLIFDVELLSIKDKS
ncbi:MAG: hypothetical protein A3H27_09465 [Acidobacteria bacterium RIFCSPLOWO2_02_FULL_59_13]|nr:MAG: hypothetical protein A3H27_09465 [Acidobacteria bacterium RIFCSPLOWO2_02_FULL_59_13]